MTDHADIDHTGLTGIGGVSSEITHNEFTSNKTVTATAEASADTVVSATAHTYDGSTDVLIHFFAAEARPSAGTIGQTLTFYLFDGSSSIGEIGKIITQAAQNANQPISLWRKLTPSAASHTYSVRAIVNGATSGVVVAGAGGSGAVVPGFIRVTAA
jgi:hypothetical protein